MDQTSAPGQNPLTLVFRDDGLERAFRVEREHQALVSVRRSLVLGTLLYGVFGLLDFSVIPEVAGAALLMRYAVVCPLFGLVFTASFHPWGRRHMHALAGSAAIVAGLGIVAMIVAAQPPGSYLYYAGLLLVCTAMYTFFQLPLTNAVALSWALVLLYEALAIGARTSGVILVNNSFFLIATNVVGMLAAHSNERVQRASFVDQQVIKTLASYDSLTGLLNRRAFFAEAENVFDRRAHPQSPAAVIMLDVDRFKALNDDYGHAGGDTVLQEVAASLAAAVRPQDVLCRYGGEEFMVFLPETTASQAWGIGERLRTRVAQTIVRTDAGTLSVTVSVGIAGIAEGEEGTLDGLIAVADRGLYAAKAGGRNLVAAA